MRTGRMMRPMDGLSGEQAARQQRLHVPTPVRHEINIDGPAFHLVHDAVRLEVRLPEIAYAEREQLFRIRAAFRVLRKRRDRGENTILHVGGAARSVVRRYPVVNVGKVRQSVRRKPDLETHLRRARLARSRRTASASGMAFPSSMWRLPSARIFKRASVSCVASYVATSCITARAWPFCVIRSGSRVSASSRIKSAALGLT